MGKVYAKSDVCENYDLQKFIKNFPEFATEQADENGKLQYVIDFDAFREKLELHTCDDRVERFRFEWAGKAESYKMSNMSLKKIKTVKPQKTESVNFDNTQNIFIEGDNLSALKILRESYSNKIKMIYIDPPYNTGKDFVYSDKFTQDSQEYQRVTGQIDDDGNATTANKETNGRFHSNWLSMMYPRLKLAKELLSDDGVIFVSIDDHEIYHLKLIMDEIFGSENFVNSVIWQKKNSPQNDARWLSDNHDFILLYAKSKEIWKPHLLPRTETQNAKYKNPDNDPRGDWMSDNLSVKTYSISTDYAITTPSGREVYPPKGRSWCVSKEKFNEYVKDNRIWFGETGCNGPTVKRFLSEVQNGLVCKTLWLGDEVGSNSEATRELQKIIEGGAFDTPKPVRLIKRMLTLASGKDSIVLDFFAGSGTTAHAVMELNAEDGGNRKFICVQLDEKCTKDSAACQAGYKTISEICRERIRRAGKKILEEHPDAKVDIGFKSFKVSDSNFIIHDHEEMICANQLQFLNDTIKPDATNEDLLYEILLQNGHTLTANIVRENLCDIELFIIDSRLIVCLSDNLTLDFMHGIYKKSPEKFICKECAFHGDDVLRYNTSLIFSGKNTHGAEKVITFETI